MERIMPKILLFCLVTQTTLIQAQTPTNNLIDFICKQTSDYTTCSVALNNDTRSANITTTRDFANLQTIQVIDKDAQIYRHIVGLLNDPKTENVTKTLLKKCDYYSIEVLAEQAFDALAGSNYNAAKESMGEIPDIAQKCKSSFQKEGHGQSIITDDTKSMATLSSVARDVIAYKANHPTPP